MNDIQINSIEILDCFVKGLHKVADHLDIRITISKIELTKSIPELKELNMSHVLGKDDFKSICSLGVNGNQKKLKSKYHQIEDSIKSHNRISLDSKQINETKILNLLNKLDDFTSDLKYTKISKVGRPSALSLREKLFCMSMVSFFGKSSRESYDYTNFAKKHGYLSKIPHFNSILSYYNDANINEILKLNLPLELTTKHKELLYNSPYKKEIAQQNDRLILVLTHHFMDSKSDRPLIQLNDGQKGAT